MLSRRAFVKGLVFVASGCWKGILFGSQIATKPVVLCTTYLASVRLSGQLREAAFPLLKFRQFSDIKRQFTKSGNVKWVKELNEDGTHST